MAMLDIEFGYNYSYHLVPTDSEDPQVGCILGRFVVFCQPGINPLNEVQTLQNAGYANTIVYMEGKQACCHP